MRVAVVSDLLRPNGAGVMAIAGADLLADAGHEVLVLAGAVDAGLQRDLRARPLSVSAFTHDERSLDGSVTTSDHIAFLRAFRRWFEAQLDEWTPDLLHVHNCGRVLGQLDLADLSQRVPVVHTMHDEWFFTDAHYTFQTSREGPTVRTFEPGRAERFVDHRYDHVFDVPGRVGRFSAIAPSEWLAQRCRSVFPTIDVQHLPNGVDAAQFALQDRDSARTLLGLPTDRPLVLFVGSPTQERKGFATFERAMRSLDSSHGEPVRLVAGGNASMVTDGLASSIRPGPIADNLAAPTPSPVGSLGLGGDALVVSGLERSLVPALYGAADVLVHPSIIDNLPTVPIEAGLCGTRCLASDVGGTGEVIADPGDLFSLDDPPEVLGERIARAIDDARGETIDDRRARRDRQTARFSIGDHRARLVALFDDLLSGVSA